MAIDKTELAPGLVLTGTYKKQEHTVGRDLAPDLLILDEFGLRRLT